MNKLSYKTRNNVSPSGKPKVYFCCHPDDFDIYFESISDELLDIQSCSVWYRDRSESQQEDAFFDDLLQMQLFVIPVTGRFLRTKNDALDKEF